MSKKRIYFIKNQKNGLQTNSSESENVCFGPTVRLISDNAEFWLAEDKLQAKYIIFRQNAVSGKPNPSHLVMYDIMWSKLSFLLHQRDYKLCRRYFNTHFPQSSRQGQSIIVACSRKTVKNWSSSGRNAKKEAYVHNISFSFDTIENICNTVKYNLYASLKFVTAFSFV